MSYTRKALRGAFVSYIFLSLSTVAALAIKAVLARGLSVNQFGLFYAVLAFVGMFTFLRDLGLSEAQVRFIPGFLHRGQLGRLKGLLCLVLSIQMVSGALFFLAFSLLATWLSTVYFRNEAAAGIIVLLGLSFLFEGIVEAISMAFNAAHSIFLQSSMQFLQLLAVLVVSVLSLDRLGVRAPALGYLLGGLLAVVVYFPLLHRVTYPFLAKTGIQLSRKDVKEYLGFSIPLVPATAAIDFLYGKLTVALLTLFGTLSQVALFSAALTVSKLLRHVFDPIRTVLFPMSAELWEKGRKDRLGEGISLLYRYALIVTLPLAGILIAFPEELLRILFGEQYTAGISVLRILGVAMVLVTYVTILEAVFMGIGQSALATKQIWAGGIINLAAGLLLIPKYGMLGAALTLLLALLGRLALGLASLGRFVRVHSPWDSWLRTTLAAAVFVGIITLLKTKLALAWWLEAGVALAAASAAYAGLLLLLRVISKEELETLWRRLRPLEAEAAQNV